MQQAVVDRKEVFLIGGAILAMMAVRMVMVATSFDPDYDQAMLLANFPLAHLSDLLHPLPYFEQTTTLGHGFLMDVLARVFGPEDMARIHAIRLVAASAFCASLLWLYFLLRDYLTPTEALLSIAMIGSSPTALTFTANSKHYAFEFVATVVLLGAALHYLRKPNWQRGFLVALAGLFVSLFAFVAPLTIAAIGVAALVAQVVDGRQRHLPAPQVWRTAAGTVAVGVVLVVIASAFYLGYTRVVTVNDLSAFSERDAEKFIEIRSLLSPQSLRNALEYGTYLFKYLEVGAEEFETRDRLDRVLMAAPAIAVFIVGIIALRKRAPFWVTAAIAAPVFTLALNLAQSFPFSGVRQHMFAVPLFAPVMVVGLMSVVRWIADRIAVPRAAEWMFVLLGTVSISLSGVGASRMEGAVSHLVDHIEASDAPVWAYYGAQPLLRTLRPRWTEEGNGQILGLIPHGSSNQRWIHHARFDNDEGMLPDYYRSSVAAISGHDRIWLVFSMWYFDIARTQGLELFLRHGRGPGRDCAVWRGLHRTLAAYCGPDAEVAAMKGRLPRERSEEWESWTRSGDWIRYIKGETGDLVRSGNPQPPEGSGPVSSN